MGHETISKQITTTSQVQKQQEVRQMQCAFFIYQLFFVTGMNKSTKVWRYRCDLPTKLSLQLITSFFSIQVKQMFANFQLEQY